MLHYNNSLRIWCIGSAPVDANAFGHYVLYQTAPPHRSVSNCGCNSRPQEAHRQDNSQGIRLAARPWPTQYRERGKGDRQPDIENPIITQLRFKMDKPNLMPNRFPLAQKLSQGRRLLSRSCFRYGAGMRRCGAVARIRFIRAERFLLFCLSIE